MKTVTETKACNCFYAEYAVITHAKFTQSLRKVYAILTQSLLKVYAKITQSLRKVYAKFTQSLRKVYAIFTQFHYAIILRNSITQFTRARNGEFYAEIPLHYAIMMGNLLMDARRLKFTAGWYGALEISSRKMVSEFREGSGSRLIYGFKFRLR